MTAIKGDPAYNVPFHYSEFNDMREALAAAISDNFRAEVQKARKEKRDWCHETYLTSNHKLFPLYDAIDCQGSFTSDEAWDILIGLGELPAEHELCFNGNQPLLATYQSFCTLLEYAVQNGLEVIWN